MSLWPIPERTLRRWPALRHAETRWLLVVVLLAVIIGVAARCFYLSYPDRAVFDEVYFPVFAQKYIQGTDVFDVHPPFGKLLIALGELGLGNTQLGWRIMPLLAGLALIGAAARLWLRHSKDRFGALLLAAFVAMDGAFIAYSRVGLMDGLLVLFMVLTLLVLAEHRKGKSLLLVGLLLGLTVAIKWVGLAVLAPLLYLAWRKRVLKELGWACLVAALLYVAVVAFGEWRDGSTNLAASVLEWHRQAIGYHLRLVDTHPWSSAWWQWPFQVRPVLFIYDSSPDGSVQLMTSLGNPLLWWASTAAAVWSFGYLLWLRIRRTAVADHPLLLPLIGWAAAYLPWALVHRVVFQYHYMPAYLFALMMLAYWGGRAWRETPWLVVGGLAIALLVSLYFMPWAVGWWPLSPDSITQHLWLRHWLY
jgi:dolichyl-phosphate-mannose--protein O-mannosyl transferase